MTSIEFTDEELSLMKDMLDVTADSLHHYPDEFTETETQAFHDLSGKFAAAFRAAGFWWAR